MIEEFLEARKNFGSKPLPSLLGAEAENTPKIKRKGGEKDEKKRIHAHRAAGRHSYHCHSGSDSVPSFQSGKRTSKEGSMLVQLEKHRDGYADVCPRLGREMGADVDSKLVSGS
jgi:hypothetical protein